MLRKSIHGINGSESKSKPYEIITCTVCRVCENKEMLEK